MKHSKRWISAACCLILTALLALPAAAAEKTLACAYVPITKDGFVADTMDGVEARYNLGGPTLYCVDLVLRYYQEVYGLDLQCNDGTVRVLNNDDLYFEVTGDPQHGDILYGSAGARGKGYSHWALVKANNGDTLTLFEQNWRWNGQAGIDRVIPNPSGCYVAYTLKSRSGAAIARPAAFSAWAEPYVRRAVEAGIAAPGADFLADVTREDFCRMALRVLENHGLAVPAGETACESAAALGLIGGGDGARRVTREEAAVITRRLASRLGQIPAADLAVLALYRDAAEISPWAVDAVAAMTGCGLMSGTDGSFQPKGAVTGEQAAALLVRLGDSAGLTYCAAVFSAEGIALPDAYNISLSRMTQLA